MTWNLLKDIHLRKLEYRMRNCDELRFMVMDSVAEFTSRHGNEPWSDVRTMATLILVESEAVLDEAQAIAADLATLPQGPEEVQNTILRIAKQAQFLVEVVGRVRATILWIIESEDGRI